MHFFILPERFSCHFMSFHVISWSFNGSHVIPQPFSVSGAFSCVFEDFRGVPAVSEREKSSWRGREDFVAG